MSTNMFPITPNFNMQELTKQITQIYQAKGFSVIAIPIGTGVSITFSKNDSGIQKFIGLSLGIKANIMLQNEHIIVNFSDAEWTGKIIGFAIGWILCFIPFIIAIVGSIQQSDLPKSIGTDIQMLVSSMNL